MTKRNPPKFGVNAAAEAERLEAEAEEAAAAAEDFNDRTTEIALAITTGLLASGKYAPDQLASAVTLAWQDGVPAFLLAQAKFPDHLVKLGMAVAVPAVAQPVKSLTEYGN